MIRGLRRALLIAALSAVGCRGGTEAEPEAERTVLLGPESVVRARVEDLRAGPRLAGSLEPKQRGNLRAEVAGSVSAVGAELGDSVRRGTLLARIESDALDDAVRSARSALETARQERDLAARDLARTRRLVAAGALPRNQLETDENALASADSRLQDARSRLATAREQLANTVVRAPFSGLVSERSVHLGDVVSPGTPLLTIIDPSSLRLEASVPSEALPLLEVGAPVEFSVRGHPGETFQGTIERIAPAVDPATRQVELLITLPNPKGKLLSGLFVEGRVASVRRRGLVVPADAIETAGEHASALVLRAERVQRVRVRTGVRDGERLEVVDGLEPGDQVLIGPGKEVRVGTRVRIIADAGL